MLVVCKWCRGQQPLTYRIHISGSRLARIRVILLHRQHQTVLNTTPFCVVIPPLTEVIIWKITPSPPKKKNTLTKAPAIISPSLTQTPGLVSEMDSIAKALVVYAGRQSTMGSTILWKMWGWPYSNDKWKYRDCCLNPTLNHYSNEM